MLLEKLRRVNRLVPGGGWMSEITVPCAVHTWFLQSEIRGVAFHSLTGSGSQQPADYAATQKRVDERRQLMRSAAKNYKS